MRELPLSQGYVAVVDDDDYSRVAVYKWHASISYRRDGTIKTIYARRNIYTNGGQSSIRLHRFILGVYRNDMQVDHRDHGGLNCRRSNLRVATQAQNQANSLLRRDNKSGLKGVSWNRLLRKWSAYVSHNKQRTHLGVFSNKEDAGRAYNRAALNLFGEFALLNGVSE